MNGTIGQILGGVAITLRDIVPVVAVIAFFQLVYFRQNIPDPRRTLPGLFMVVLGLYAFVEGLTLGLFPLGETMAMQFAEPQNLRWVYLFAFLIGYSTTMAEPALIAVAMKAQKISAGAIQERPLRQAVAAGVAVGLTVGTYRLILGDPLHWYIIAGYTLVVIQTHFAPREIVALAYDSGGVTTSTVTVPLVAAIGIGLASHLPGRNPLIDGFGLIGFASLFPIMTVMSYGMLAKWRLRRQIKDSPS